MGDMEINVRARGRAWPEDHGAGPRQEKKSDRNRERGRGQWTKCEMATGATEGWVTGRPRRKEGPNGAISSPGCGRWFRKPPTKAGAKRGSRFPLGWLGWGRTPHPPGTHLA